jgi:pullulanase
VAGLVLMLNLSLSVYASNDLFPAEPYEELTYTSEGSTFTLWSPMASQVRLNLYKEGRGGNPYQEVQLKNEGRGYWKMHLPTDLNGQFYTFKILYKGEWLNESPGVSARAVGVNGHRAAILDWQQTKPAGWDTEKRPDPIPFTDRVLYALQLREYTLGKQSGIVNKGKYLGLSEKGSTNSNAFSTGIDHLADLGITHVLLSPVFDFETDDESRPKEPLRYWNYQPVNFQVPDGLYATKSFDPVSRILEFKQLVQALHQAGLRVLLDMTFSHTSDAAASAFSLTLPGWCYRLKPDGSYSNGSGYGNELATEQPFVRQYIVQTLLYWIQEYHIDGFRFDQMGLMDIETINQIRKSIDVFDPTIFLCGDGSINGSSTLPEVEQALSAHSKSIPGIASFDTDFTVALTGSETDRNDPGFLQGKPDLEAFVRFGVVGGIRHPQVNPTNSPGFMVDYASSPREKLQGLMFGKGYRLYDKLDPTAVEASPGLIRRNKLAMSLLMTSQGIPVVFSGDELLQSRSGMIGAVTMPDSVNRLDWKNKTYHNEYYEFCRGLVELRALHPAFRMASAAAVQKLLRFLETGEKCVVAYVLEQNANGDPWKTILVVHNSNDHPVSVPIPSGNWTAVVQDGRVDEQGLNRFSGATVQVDAVSTFVAFQQ